MEKQKKNKDGSEEIKDIRNKGNKKRSGKKHK
jgi:hypothetical protein